MAILAETQRDYEELTLFLTFSPCEVKKCISVRIEQDEITEETEFFTVNLERTTNLDSRITLDPRNATVNITDNDGMHYISSLSVKLYDIKHFHTCTHFMISLHFWICILHGTLAPCT